MHTCKNFTRAQEPQGTLRHDQRAADGGHRRLNNITHTYHIHTNTTNARVLRTQATNTHTHKTPDTHKHTYHTTQTDKQQHTHAKSNTTTGGHRRAEAGRRPPLAAARPLEGRAIA